MTNTACHECAMQSQCVWKQYKESLGISVQQNVYRSGQNLFEQGDECTSLYVVRAGAVKTYRYTPDGDEQVIGFQYPGAVLGVEGMADDEHPTFAQCVDTTSVCVLPKAGLLAACARSPELVKELLRVAARQVLSLIHI